MAENFAADQDLTEENCGGCLWLTVLLLQKQRHCFALLKLIVDKNFWMRQFALHPHRPPCPERSEGAAERRQSGFS